MRGSTPSSTDGPHDGDRSGPASREPDAPRPGLALPAVMLLASAALAATVPALPLWLDHLGVHDASALAAWSAAAFGGGVLASMLVTPLWGALGDRVGPRAMVLRACVGLTVAQLLMAMATEPSHVVAIRVLQGLVSGVEPAVYALAVIRHGRARTGAAIGRLEAASTAGALFGPLVMASAVMVADMAALFFTAAGLAMTAAGLTAVAVPTVSPTQARADADADASASTGARPSLWNDVATAARHRGVPRLLAAVAVVVALDVVVELLYPLLVVAHTTAGSERVLLLGAIEIAGEAAYLVAAPWLGARVDRLGPRAVLIPCAAISGVATAVAPWVPLPWLWVGLVGLGDGASSGVRAALHAEVPRRAPLHHRGTVTSLVGSANRAGAAVAAAVVPLAVAAAGLAAAMTGTGLLTVLLAAAWARRPRARDAPSAAPGEVDPGAD